MVSEINIDSSFLSDQFSLGYRTFYRLDRGENGGRIFFSFAYV